MDQTIIIATKNVGKAKEFKELFNRYGYQIKTLLDFPEIEDVPETGDTFAENAYQKASAISKKLNTIVLADDSGIEVDALNGKPGIYSARFAGEHGNDKKNNQKLLSELEGLPSEKRTANFHCSLVMVGPTKEPLYVEGNVYGQVLEEGRGEYGFGYDSLFYMKDLDKTMAELTSKEKNAISHRAQAIVKLEEQLDEWLS
ncbi:MAG: XTP/dITP diphosphatase [Atopostipes suicloacalis]|nr:XTP/dITP diphosphatase [Atopostipes suicloacalis]MDN6731316.1 XTP/dITP diphosphatase [Atopostipes suicloacalis]